MSDELKDDLGFKEFLEKVKAMHREPKPQLEDIWARLKPFTKQIKIVGVELLDEDSPLLTRCGKEYEIDWDEELKVEQVYSLEEATSIRKLPDCIEVEDKAIKRIDDLVKKHNRMEQSNAVSDLMNHYIWRSLSKRYPDELAWYIPSDFKLALTEFILFDVGKPLFFRERWAWYDAGHFPCGVKPDGTRVIY